jgi:hypothetical protein
MPYYPARCPARCWSCRPPTVDASVDVASEAVVNSDKQLEIRILRPFCHAGSHRENE